ncbi:MAG: hypothetical protein ACLSHO_09220 [Dysosmobacter sp.]
MTIEKTRSGVTYADTGRRSTAAAAQDLGGAGAFSPGQRSEISGILSRIAPSAGRNFWPWCMETAGAEVTDVTMTGFQDDAAPFPLGRKATPRPVWRMASSQWKTSAEDGAVFSGD